MRFGRYAAMTAALGMSVQAPAQQAPAEAKLAAKLRAAENWLDVQLEQEAVPGASFAIVHDQKLVWSKGFGYANLEQKIPATPQTRYSICSISKLFTSIAAMQLRDAGKLDLDWSIGDYLPWYTIGAAEKADGPVTARGILSHVSGLPREADAPYWSSAEFPTLDTVKAKLSGQTNLYRSYDYLQYSNLGMTLLGETVAAVSGQDYHSYMKTRLIDPIGLTSTTSELPRSLYGREFAVGYKSRNGKGERGVFPFYTVNGLAPAAGFASTVEDLGRFASWQFRVLEGGDKLLSSSTLREMQRVHWMAPDRTDETWGLGFVVYQHKGKTMVGHNGYCPGYRATLVMRPQDKTAYVAMVNVNDVSPDALVRMLYDLTATEVQAAYAPKKPGATAPAKPEAKSAVDLRVFEGRYRRPHYDSDIYLAPVGDELISVNLYADPPGDPTRYRHVEGTIFKRIRADDTLAEPIRFEMGRDGKPVRFWIHSNPMERVKG